MDKSIENLINPPWLKSIQRMENQMSAVTLAFQESDAMRSISKLSESTKWASLAFNESELMKAVRVAEESSKLASLAFHESEAMKSIRQFTESVQPIALAFQESKAVRDIAESMRLSSVIFQESGMAEQLQHLSKTSQLATIALQHSEAFKHISQFSNLASFRALADLDNAPFPDITGLALATEMGSVDILDEFLIQIDAEIREEISSQTDFNGLSEKTKSILLYLFHHYFLPIFLGCLSTYIMTNALEARKELEPVSTPSEVRAFIRSSNTQFDRSALKGFRVTTVKSLNFREKPSMRSEILETLPIGTLAEVIDKSHRSWLLVEVEIDGTLEQGWISRRYTAYFK